MPKPLTSAVSPTFFLEYRDIEDFIAEFGPFSGRYVSRIPKSWESSFKEHLNELSSVDRDRAVARLDALRLALIDRPTFPAFDDSLGWCRNLQARPTTLAFEHIVGDGLAPDPFPPWRDALTSIRDSRRHGELIRGSVQDYIDHVEPLLLNAPAAYLIDPYFRVLEEGELILRRLFDLIRGSRCYEVHVITRDEPDAFKAGRRTLDRNEFSEKIREVFLPHIPGDRKLYIHLLDDDNKRDDNLSLRLHNRYFLTRNGALDFGLGFKIANKKVPQIPVNVVAREIHKSLVESYIKGVTLRNDRWPRAKDVVYPRPHSITTYEASGTLD